MNGVVDADTHIAEPEAMWKLIDEKMAPRRPVLVGLPDDTWFGDRNALWLIDGNIFPKPAGKGAEAISITIEAAPDLSYARLIEVMDICKRGGYEAVGLSPMKKEK